MRKIITKLRCSSIRVARKRIQSKEYTSQRIESLTRDVVYWRFKGKYHCSYWKQRELCDTMIHILQNKINYYIKNF